MSPSAFLSDSLDPRLTPARADLAASWLKDKVKASKYVEPTRQQITSACVNMYRMPREDAIETQLLFGEPVDVFERAKGWAWVQSVRDSYVGYIEEKHLSTGHGDNSPTHRVSNIGAFVYPEPSIKTTPLMTLSYGAQVQVKKRDEKFCELASGGFVSSVLLTENDFHADDYIAEAFRFLGVPYLWGGRSHTGVDCSSLVQLVLQACNYKCPRDSVVQEKHLGKPIDRDNVQAGDLVFFSPHVGIMVDDCTIIHANDRAMAVSIDDLDEYCLWRSKNGGTPIKMFKRL